jgi:hypothetical protein
VTQESSVYGPGAICDTCGHFAAHHDEHGCHGVTQPKGCVYGIDGQPCGVFRWQGRDWPRPWLPEPEGLATMTLWYIARCEQCDFNMPFRDEAERDRWAEEHRQADDPWYRRVHVVTTFEENEPRGYT